MTHRSDCSTRRHIGEFFEGHLAAGGVVAGTTESTVIHRDPDIVLSVVNLINDLQLKHSLAEPVNALIAGREIALTKQVAPIAHKEARHSWIVGLLNYCD
jgi:hypothetical protein